MDSPKRKAQKNKDYRRHRMMRLLNRRKATAQEAMSEIAERELMRKLRITPLKKFEGGKDAEYDAVILDDVVITGKRRPANIMFDKDTGNYYRESTGDVVTPVNKLVEDDPSTWSFTDKNGTTFTPHGPVFNSNQGEIRQAEEAPLFSNDYIKQAAHNYMSELAYDINNNRVVGGKYTMPAIAAVAASPLLGNVYGNAAVNSAFAAHGLNHAVNEGVDGIGDAAVTTLEMLPLFQMSSKFIPNLFENAQRYVKQFPYRLRVPIDSERYYRIVSGDGAILDANRSGMITRPYVEHQKAEFPYFTKGMLYSDVNKSFDLSNPRVIVSKPNQNFIKVHDGLDEIDKVSSIAVGDSATPIVQTRYGTAYNSAPAENFEYYTKGNGFLSKYFWKKHQFTPFQDSYKISPEMLGESIAEGSEASVYNTLENPYTVTKVYDGWAKDINPFGVRDIVTTRNSVPGAMTSKIKGFTEDGYPVVEQGRVIAGGDGSGPFTRKQIKDLESLLKSNDYSVGRGVEIDAPTKNGVQIRDLSPQNIGYDYNGNLRIIDPDVDAIL